jgi:hypothetical protein
MEITKEHALIMCSTAASVDTTLGFPLVFNHHVPAGADVTFIVIIILATLMAGVVLGRSH